MSDVQPDRPGPEIADEQAEQEVPDEELLSSDVEQSVQYRDEPSQEYQAMGTEELRPETDDDSEPPDKPSPASRP